MLYIDINRYLIGTNCILSMITNSLLVYLVTYHTKNDIGRYRILMIIFACFNICYSFVFFTSMPIHLLADSSWLAFSVGPFAGFSFAQRWLGLYCTFYELWVTLLVVHFVYRYVVVCKPEWKEFLSRNTYPKFLIGVVMLIGISYTLMCGIFLCTHEVMSEALIKHAQESFHFANPRELPFILIRITELTGGISPIGFTTLINHFILANFSSVIIVFCGYNTFSVIREMSRENGCSKAVSIQRQLFNALLLQTLIPTVLCHLPSMFYLSFPLWGTNLSMGSFSLLFNFTTSLNKILDPIMIMICVGEYRRKVLRFVKKTTKSISSMTSSVHSTTHREPQSRPSTSAEIPREFNNI